MTYNVTSVDPNNKVKPRLQIQIGGMVLQYLKAICRGGWLLLRLLFRIKTRDEAI